MKKMFIFVLVGALGLPLIPTSLNGGLGITVAFAKKKKEREYTKEELRKAERDQEKAEKAKAAAARELRTTSTRYAEAETEMNTAKEKYDVLRRTYRIVDDNNPPANLDSRKREAFDAAKAEYESKRERVNRGRTPKTRP